MEANNDNNQRTQQQQQQQQQSAFRNDTNNNNAIQIQNDDDDLPKNRFELELEFVQALASPAYIHFLATTRSESETGNGELLLQDPALQAFLRYLYDTWSRPEYVRFLQYPHALYFLELLLENPTAAKEWTLPAYRNFAHQQQFYAWQHRHSTYYGVGSSSLSDDANNNNKDNNNNGNQDPAASSSNQLGDGN
jgi:SOH1